MKSRFCPATILFDARPVVGNQNFSNKSSKRLDQQLTMPRSRSYRDGKHTIVTTVTIGTQTEENEFCLCFVPTYTCKNDENIELDQRISADLNHVDWLNENGMCFVRNFETRPIKSAKQRWRISGNTVRAFNKFKRKKRFLDVTFNDPDEGEPLSGLYTREINVINNSSSEGALQQRNRGWSPSKIFGRRRFSLERSEGSQQFQSQSLLTANSTERSVQNVESQQQKTEENLIIENYINQCMQESKAKKNAKNIAVRKPKHGSVSSFEEGEQKRRNEKDQSVTLPDGRNGGSSRQRDDFERRDTVPRDGRHTEKEIPDNMRRSSRSKQKNQPNSRSHNNSHRNNDKQKSSQNLLAYLEKSDESGGNQMKRDVDQTSEHGSAFALVPGTDLQRKLSQRGINDKASLNSIVNSENKQKFREVRSVIELKHEKNRQQNFHSVDNIFASSAAKRDGKYATHMTSQLQSSYSADDIDECMFKPLDTPQQNHKVLPHAIFAVTSTPRDDLYDDLQNEEGFATYV